MVAERLIQEFDLQCSVGVMRRGGEEEYAFILADYGHDYEPMTEFMRQHQRVLLETQPVRGEQILYVLHGDLILGEAEIVAAQGLGTSQIVRPKTCRPLFAVSYRVDRLYHDHFQRGFARWGFYLLILQARRDTWMLIDKEGCIRGVQEHPRQEFAGASSL